MINELSVEHYVYVNNPNARPNDVGKIAIILAIDSERQFKEYKGTVRVQHLGELESYGQFLDFIKPIPITKEIICRLELNGERFVEKYPDVWEQGNLRFYEKEGVLSWEVWDGVDLDNITYLHQLQNFCLTVLKKKITIL